MIDITYDTVAAGLITQEITEKAAEKENKEAALIWLWVCPVPEKVL